MEMQHFCCSVYSLISFISRVWIIRKFLHWFFVKRIAKNGKCYVNQYRSLSYEIKTVIKCIDYYEMFCLFSDLALQDLKEKRKKIVSH